MRLHLAPASLGLSIVAMSGLAAFLTGCAGGTPYGLIAKMTGHLVDKVAADSLEKKLLGKPTSAATEELGAPVEILDEVPAGRSWYLYKAKVDILDDERYMLEVKDDTIVRVSKITTGGATTLDLPRALLIKDKVRGKTPAAAEAALDMGQPILTLINRQTDETLQLYDARIIELGKRYYCRLHFSPAAICTNVDFITVTGKDMAD